MKLFKWAGALNRYAISKCRTRYFSTASTDIPFPGAPKTPYIFDIEFEKDWAPMSCTRYMNSAGEIIKPGYTVKFTDKEIIDFYHHMVRINEIDKRFYDAQRQGRISFYMTNFGEEGAQIGSASALNFEDMVFGQYRELGVILYRGFTIQQVANQCFSNYLDLGKGRQMPVHYGARHLNFQTIKSPLATQIPHAAGAGYAIKRENEKLKKEGKEDEQRCAVCYFGEGAASEGDFAVALNFAATLDCPVIFFCRNNGYAISTPANEQYRGDGIASRGRGYGVASIRVDGNDFFAVHDVVKAARELCIKESRPVLVEALTYRLGHHSTSDDSTRYRTPEEIKSWETNNPVTRLRLYMEKKGLWDADKEVQLRSNLRKEVMNAMLTAEKVKKGPHSLLFQDVYKELPPHLQQQQEELVAHVKKYKTQYGHDLDEFLEEDQYTPPPKSR